MTTIPKAILVAIMALCAVAQDVTVPAVVRDKNKAVVDLTAQDFSLTQDGAKIAINDVRLVDGMDIVSGGVRAPAGPALKTRLVSLVFEKLGEDPRRIARQAALDFAKNAPPNYLISVFQIDKQLTLMQPFTNEKDVLKKAIDRATDGRYQVYQEDSNKMRQKLNSGATLVTGADPAIAAQVNETLKRMMQFEEGIEDTEATRRTIFSLLSLSRGQWGFPGRKAIALFSQGLYVFPNMEEAFRALTASVNRGGVSIYTLDATGLAQDRQTRNASRELADAGVLTSGAGGAGTFSTGGGESDASQRARPSEDSANAGTASGEAQFVRAAESGENASRNNRLVRLQELSDATGGVVAAETNDLRGALKRLVEDMSSYYQVTFGAEALDGKIHKISLEAPRGKVSGPRDYTAAPIDSAAATIVLPYEAALMEALEAKPHPSKVNYHAGLFHLQPGKDGVQAMLIVEVPMSNLTFTEDAASKSYRARTSVLAVIRDASGKTVKQFSRDLPLTGPNDKIALIRQGNFVYRENVTLPAGKYALETAASDGEGGQFGAMSQPVEVVATKGIGISSLFLVRNYQQGVKDLKPDEALQFNGGRITPSMTGRIIGSKGTMLAVFFTVYPDGTATKPELTIEYLAGGDVLASAPLQLPAADAMGRIPYVMSSPADSLPAGQYEIRATVKQNGVTARESTLVTVEAPKP